jgi:hypothetical protein
MAGNKIADEILAEAESLLANGVSYRDVAAQTGITPVTLYRKFPQYRKRKPDPTPGGGTSTAATDGKPKTTPKVPKPGITDEKLVDFYSKVASAPAVPMLLLAHCQFCAAHFNRTGPTAAVQLVTMSKENASLRSLLENGYDVITRGAWAGVLLMYAGVPLAHHLAPDNLYNVLAFFNVLPDRNEVEEFHAGHAHDEPEDAAEPVVTGLEDVDIDQLARMAEGFGIRLDPDMVAMAARMMSESGSDEPVINVAASDILEDDEPATPEPDEPEQQAAAEAEDAAEAVEAAASDPLGSLTLP